MALREYGASSYGDRIADLYDSWYTDEPDTAGTVEALARLAGPGPVLELGIGTGRIAIPLVERGIEVHGIELSVPMVERLRQKRVGRAIPVTIGDFGEVAVEGRYSLVFCVFSTLFCLPDQEAQVRCFANVAAHLQPGGLFVTETIAPDLARFDRRQSVRIGEASADHVVLVATKVDPAAQTLVMHRVMLSDGGVRVVPGVVRYAWPSELDLMARMAGLRLRQRTQTWRGEPFTRKSTNHVSVYEPDPGAR
jgi:SAM-dependent methyltransferase